MCSDCRNYFISYGRLVDWAGKRHTACSTGGGHHRELIFLQYHANGVENESRIFDDKDGFLRRLERRVRRISSGQVKSVGSEPECQLRLKFGRAPLWAARDFRSHSSVIEHTPVHCSIL